MQIPWKELKARLRGGRAAAGLGVVQLVGIGTSLTMAILLARILGPAGFGQYVVYFALANLLGLAADCGMWIVSIREVAAARGQGRWGYIRGYIRFCLWSIAAASVLISGAGAALLALAPEQFSPEMRAGLPVVLAMVLPLALERLTRGLLIGLDLPVLADLSINAVRPGLALSCVAWLAAFAPERITPLLVLEIQAVVLLVGLAYSIVLSIRNLPGEVFTSASVAEHRKWAGSGFNLWFQHLLLVGLNEIVLLSLAVLSSTATVGFFRVAQRGMAIVGLAMTVLRQIASPRMAALHGQGDSAALEAYCQRLSRITMALQAAAFLAILLFGHWAVTLVFGPAFGPAVLALQIWSVQVFVEAALGLSTLILVMTGQERDMSWISAVGAVAVVAFLFALGSVNSAAQAAGAMVAADALRQALARRQVRRRLGINPSALPF